MGPTRRNHGTHKHLCAITFLFFLPLVCSFTSVYKLRRLYEMEGKLLSVARFQFQNIGLRFRLESFQSFLRITGNERSTQSLFQPSPLLPVVQYRLILRFCRQWFIWRRLLLYFAHPKIRKFLSEYKRLSLKYHRVDALPCRFHHYPVYALNMLELVYGAEASLSPDDKTITASRFHLSPCEAFEFATITLNQSLDGFITLLVPVWIERAIRHLRLRYPYWSDTQRLTSALKTCRFNRIISPATHQSLKNRAANLDFLLDSYREFVSHEVKPDPEVQACSVMEKFNSTLYCFYFNGLLGPYAPFKYELRHQFVSVIHDLLPPSMATQIIEAAAPTMRTSRVSEDNEDVPMLVVRLSEDGHIENSPYLREWLNRRIHVATSMRTDVGIAESASSEVPSVINYGIGGFYQCHFDYFQSTEIHQTNGLSSGNRLATVMAFLSSGVYGGHTGFPNLDLSVKPSIGKGLFWFNLHPVSKRLLDESLHCACAVVHGSKWIVTKWIREHNNFGAVMPTSSNLYKQYNCDLKQ